MYHLHPIMQYSSQNDNSQVLNEVTVIGQLRRMIMGQRFVYDAEHKLLNTQTHSFHFLGPFQWVCAFVVSCEPASHHTQEQASERTIFLTDLSRTGGDQYQISIVLALLVITFAYPCLSFMYFVVKS